MKHKLSVTMDEETSKGDAEVFSDFSLDELRFLSNRIVDIDIQNGCAHMCLGCGRDAPKPNGNMPYEDYLKILKGIKSVKVSKDIDLLPDAFALELKARKFGRRKRLIVGYKRIHLFDASDPPHYRNIDSTGAERTLWDILDAFYETFDRTVSFTTAGWKSGDNYVEKAMAKIVQSNIVSHIEYSVKPFGAMIRSEFDLHDGSTSSFIRQSKYVENVKKNMKTLGGLKVKYRIFYLEKNVLRRLPENNKKYTPIFSLDFMLEMADHLGLDPNKKETFGGVGRAMKDFNMREQHDLHFIRKIERKGRSSKSRAHIDEDDLYGVINHKGVLNIIYGKAGDSLEQIPVSKDYFLGRAKHNEKIGRDSGASLYYMLANLQGRKLL